jgi:spore maturation protein CgeB
MLRIFYVGNKYYDHDPAKGFAFDHTNIYDSLRRMPGVEIVEYFDYDRVKMIGKDRLNIDLLEAVERTKPDVFFSIMYHEDVKLETLDRLRGATRTLGFFPDDQWHFHNSSAIVAPHLDWIATTYSRAVPWYRALGCKNVIRTHLGANHLVFVPPKAGLERFKYDVSFVGAWYINRERVIRAIGQAGIGVATWGPGWPQGRLPDNRMVSLVHETKVNIDINPPSSHIGVKPFMRLFLRRGLEGGFVPDFKNTFVNMYEWWQKRTPMIKPRTFNCLAAKSFVITQRTHDTSEYYVEGKELVVYDSTTDLIAKIKHYLDHNDEREAIARAGYERTIRDHTYEKRFQDIFKEMGLSHKLEDNTDLKAAI